jgi:hypothetical protein
MNECIHHWFWKQRISLHRGPIGRTCRGEGGSFTADLVFGRGGRRLQEMCKRRLWKWVTLSIVAPWGNLEEGSFTRDFEIQ